MNRPLIALAAAAALVLGLPARAASSFYTDESAFDAAVGGATLQVQDFEGPPSDATDTSLTYGAATFSCRPTGRSTYCPGYFGARTGYGTDGTTTLYGSTPDALTFRFTAPVTAFAIDAIGVGTNGATNFSITLSNGASQVVLADFSQPGAGANFIGAYDAAGFTSVTFTGTHHDDGVDFDRMQTAVPEPATVALMLAGLGLVGVAARRRRG